MTDEQDGYQNTPSTDRIVSYKQQARRLREAMQEQGGSMTHGAALEMVARSHGFRDWNTLAALEKGQPNRMDGEQPLPFAVGRPVRGRYLGHAFTGKVLSVTSMAAGGLYKVVIHFDEPVDVVTFDSFSALRSRISADVGRDGVSPRKTSNGLPQLIIEG